MDDFSFSVIIVTYNQEAYISQALESVLCQDLSHVKEIYVSDDGSCDGTVSIVKSYCEKNTLIKLITKEQDFNPQCKRIPEYSHIRIRNNYIRAISVCSGDYIAILEGDDYWHEGKLKYLYSLFSGKNFEPKNYSFFFHKYNVFKNGIVEERCYKHSADSEIDIHENIREYEVQNLSCCVYDSKILKSVLSDFTNINGVDYSLNILCLEHKKAYFIAKTYSTYRISQKGVWSRLNEEQKEIRNIQNRLTLNSFFSDKYRDDFYYGIDEAVKRYISVRGGGSYLCSLGLINGDYAKLLDKFKKIQVELNNKTGWIEQLLQSERELKAKLQGKRKFFKWLK